MAAFERLLCGESGPVLTPALVELCMRVEHASDPVAAEAALADAAGHLMPRVVRAYKWRRCFCTWLPPPDGEFYGLDVRRPPPGAASSGFARSKRTWKPSSALAAVHTALQASKLPPPSDPFNAMSE